MRLIDADALIDKMVQIPGNRWNTKTFGEALDSIPTIGGWISVKDRLPEKSGEYLVVRNSFGICRTIDVCGYDKKSKKFGKIDMEYAYDDNGWYEIDSVTHWMNLPDLPKEEDDENDQ